MIAVRPIDETYQDVEKLIYHAVHKFYKSHGGDIDEMIGVANQVFMDSYEAFDASKGTFTGFLYLNITRRLQDLYWHEKRRKTMSLDSETEDGTTFAGQVEDYRTSKDFDLMEFAEGMSQDAMEVLKLVLESPAELASVAMGKGGNPRNWRSTVREFLYGMGWSGERISESFEEISGALAGA